MKWVLIIEPSNDRFNYLNRVISRLGYRSYRAVSAYEGIRFLGESIPDAILCGEDLPDRNLLDLCRGINEDPMTTGTPLLVTSSNKGRFFRRRALKAGAVEVVDMAAPVRDLFQKLEVCLSDSRRKMIRAPMRIPIKVRYQGSESLHVTHTFGEGGLFLPTYDPLVHRSVAELDFTLPGANNKFNFEGQVVYSMHESTDHCPPGMGLQFLDVTQALKTLLGVYMENHLTLATVSA